MLDDESLLCFEPISEEDKTQPPVTRWSPSTLLKFEACPYKVFIEKAVGVREPSGPAAERGTQVHQMCEDFVQGARDDMPKEMQKFKNQFLHMRDLYTQGEIIVEEDWAFDANWEQCDWDAPNAWLRLKCDAVHLSGKTASIYDYKTGRKQGNEIKHGTQMLIYAIAAFHRHPELEYLETWLWYLDKGETTTQRYTRQEAMDLLPRLNDRGLAITTCTDFLPRPSAYNCKWCKYKEMTDAKGKPHCEWGV